MTDLIIKGRTAERLQHIAQRENRPVEAIIETLLNDYERAEEPSSANEDDSWYRAFRSKLYKKARDYWQRTGNQARLSLSDEQLDQQFWLIDHEGIPRLNADQDSVNLPPDPLEAIDGLFADSDLTDMSTTVHETLADYYRKKHERTD